MNSQSSVSILPVSISQRHRPSAVRLLGLAGAFVLTLLLTLLIVSPLYAETFTVNSTDDAADATPGDGICATGSVASGGDVCTLRAAIEEANASLGVPDTIGFSIPAVGLQSIHVSTSLPVISDTLTIDGLTQPSAACPAPFAPANLLIELNGSGTTSMTNGLELAGNSAGSTIRGLVINQFGANGVRLASDGNNVVCNYIGVDATGNIAKSNGSNGVLINNASDNIVGGTTPAERNVIAGNGGSGVSILTGDEVVVEEESGGGGPHLGAAAPSAAEEEVTVVTPALRNRVLGNYIGVNSAGTVALGNKLNGVQVSGSGVDALGVTVYTSFNEIGAPDGRNVIAGNLANGVALVEAAMTNTVSSNYIGINAPGKGPLANALVGVLLENAADNLIEQNLISGNTGNGVHIADPPSSIAATGNLLHGNRIGLNAAGDKAIPNGGVGVGIQNASHNTIGGPNESDRNIISGNTGDGIIVQRSPDFNALENRIENNYIGVNAAATVAIGNGGTGVHLFNAEVTTVHNNVIGGNAAGIAMAAPETYGNIITANVLGTDPTQTYVFGNGEHGIFINSNATDNRIGGTNPGEGNIIAFHSGRGIWMTSAGAVGNAIRGNSIHDNQGTETENKLGIDLTGSGPNPNDLTDIDTGPNMLQNYPDLIGVYNFSGGTYVNALLNSVPNSNFAVDFFYNNSCDPSGYGEGEFYMESITVTTDADGYVGFSHRMAVAAEDRPASMTATDSKGNTSEFSLCAAPVNAIIVNSTNDNDDGSCDLTHCSLREAINLANADVDESEIVFGIAGKGPHVIAPTSPLPTVSHPTIIDGTSQPGAVCPADILRPAPLEALDPTADLAQLLSYYGRAKPPGAGEKPTAIVITPTLQIVLNGGQIGAANNDGLTMAGGNSTVTGLTIQNFTGNGLVLTASGNNHVTCNLIGTDAEALMMQGNGGNGILVDNVAGNVIGESEVAATTSQRNIVSANGGAGVAIQGPLAVDNQVAGNFIGLDATGSADFGNGSHGIFVDVASNTLIGGSDPEARLRNVIAGNGGAGIAGSEATVTILGNFIGTDINGTSPIGNDLDGIHLREVSDSRIEANLISANGATGIYMEQGARNLLQANFVGSDLWRVGWLGNQSHGMALLNISATQILSNGVAYNHGAGINLTETSPVSTNAVSIANNVIHDNDLLGVDLAGDYITLNDPTDTDIGPNNLQNYPELERPVSDGVSTLIAGTLDTLSNADYTLQFFVNVTCDPLGNGEGRVLLGQLPATTDVTGHADFTFSYPVSLPKELVVTANTMDSAGNTSEFSACGTPFVTEPAVDLALNSSPNSGKPGEQIEALLTVVNQGNIADSFVISIDSDWPAEASSWVVGPLPPSISSQFTVKLTVPENTPVDESNHTIVTATSSFRPTVSDSVDFSTVATQKANVTLTPAEQADSTLPGSDMLYSITVTNTGNGMDSFAVQTSGTWATVPSVATIGPLAAGSSQSFIVRVTIPADAAADASDTGTVTVMSQFDNAVTANATLTTTAQQFANLTLTVALDNQEALPGEMVAYQFTLVNKGNGEDEFTIHATGDWLAIVPVAQSGVLAGDETFNFTVGISVPVTAIFGDQSINGIKATSQFDAAVQEEQSVTTKVKAKTSLLLSATTTSKQGTAETIVTYDLTVINNGTMPTSGAITAMGLWEAQPSSSNSGILQPGDSFNFQVDVTIPAGALVTDSDTATVTVTSQNDPSATDSVQLVTTVAPTEGVSLSVDIEALMGEAGGTSVYYVTIVNTSNHPETFSISSDGLWTTMLSADSTGELAPGASFKLVVEVLVPGSSTEGESNITTITVTAQSDPTVQQQLSLTTGHPWVLYLPTIER